MLQSNASNDLMQTKGMYSSLHVQCTELITDRHLTIDNL